MNTRWDNCKKAAATTGKQLLVSCFVLHSSTRKNRYTVLYREGLTHLLLSYPGWLMTKLSTGRHFTQQNFRRTFLPLNFTFFLDTFFISGLHSSFCWRNRCSTTAKQGGRQEDVKLEEAIPREAAGQHTQCSFLLWTEDESLSPPWHRNTTATFATHSFRPWSS